MISQQVKGYKFLHLFFWLLVAVIWFYLRYQDYISLQQAVLVTFTKVTYLAMLIYFANLVLVPRLLYRKKYGWFVFAFITIIALASFVKMLTMAQMQQTGAVLISKETVYNNFVTQFFLVLASIGIKSVVDYLKLQK